MFGVHINQEIQKFREINGGAARIKVFSRIKKSPFEDKR